MRRISGGLLVGCFLFCGAGPVWPQVEVRHIQTDKSPIAAGVWAGDTYYLSGQLADPVTLKHHLMVLELLSLPFRQNLAQPFVLLPPRRRD